MTRMNTKPTIKRLSTDVSKINITDNTMEFIQGTKVRNIPTSMSARKSWLIRKGIVEYASSLKRLMQTLDNSSMFSLATTISPRSRQSISISSLEALAKKPSLKRWTTGQPTIQMAYQVRDCSRNVGSLRYESHDKSGQESFLVIRILSCPLFEFVSWRAIVPIYVLINLFSFKLTLFVKAL